MTRKLLYGTALVSVNAAIVALWWLWTKPGAYLWTRSTPEVTEVVRHAGRAVFWWRWPV